MMLFHIKQARHQIMKPILSLLKYLSKSQNQEIACSCNFSDDYYGDQRCR